MPVVVITPSKATPGKVCEYIMQDKKTCNELKFSSYCTPDCFDKDFEMVQDAYGRCQKRESRKYYHIKLSWSTKDGITPQKAKDMAMRFCDDTNIRGCQYAGSIHTDTKTIHAHIVVNNVRVEDNEYGKAGYSYQATKQSREEMMEKANDIAREYGLLHSVLDLEKEAKERYSRGEIELYKKNEIPWKEGLRCQILDARENTDTWKEFKEYLMEQHGVDIAENKKGQLRYFPSGKQDGEKGCPAKRLGEEYEKDELERFFHEKEKGREYCYEPG